MDDKIHIPFVREANGYKYSDCLILSKDHTFTEEQIEQIKNQRFARWIEMISAASSVETPTEELQAQQTQENIPSAGE